MTFTFTTILSDPIQVTCLHAETQLLYPYNREREKEIYLAQLKTQEKHELHVC